MFKRLVREGNKLIRKMGNWSSNPSRVFTTLKGLVLGN